MDEPDKHRLHSEWSNKPLTVIEWCIVVSIIGIIGFFVRIIVVAVMEAVC